MDYDVIIIGAGPAGLFSALTIKNKSILLLEKNLSSGKKLVISGAGQCNYTNSCDLTEFLSKYGEKNKGRFLKPALYNFTNNDAVNFFEKAGVRSTAREDGKVFPESLKASDILDALIKKCKENNAEIKYNSPVSSVEHDGTDSCFRVRVKDSVYKCRYLVITPGGRSFPKTGSTGDGFVFAAGLGHSIREPRPALVPIFVEDYKFQDLSGVSCQNIFMSQWRSSKKINEFEGDILFTHKNISGPVVINNSRYIEKGDILRINFTGFKNHEEFKKVFEQKISSSGKLNVKTVIREFNLQKRLIDKIMELSRIEDNKICSQLDKAGRNKLAEMLSGFPMKVDCLGPEDSAMVTRGGVSTDEINSKTMESKIVNNLYFAGEVMDIDGDTGGFNIQAAFSMGKLAGDSINSKFIKSP